MWYKRLKTAAPYTENICPVCTSAILIDFYHEKGERYEKAPYVVGECPKCGAAIKICGYNTKEVMGFNQSSATEMSHQQYLAARLKGIPSVLVALNDDGDAPGCCGADSVMPKTPALASFKKK